MSEYMPDRWVVLKISNGEEVIYKVMGGWYGGYLGADSWRMNSGITKVELDGDTYKFYGHSGSVYLCPKNNYGMTVFMSSVLPYSDDVQILPDFDFTILLGDL
jgi:hypothetical protein